MKKGFTLIELLAVILILGIIALIAIPAVTNVIEDSKKNAAEVTAMHYIKAIDDQNALYKLQPNRFTPIQSGDIDDIEVNLNGEGPTSGTVTITNGKVTEAELCANGYTVTYNGIKSTVGNKCGVTTCTVEDQIFEYTGNVQTYTITCAGTYKLEVWGAQGGTAGPNETNQLAGGKGGYSTGTITLNKKDKLFIVVGGKGENATSVSGDYLGGYNGGGNAYHWKNNNIYNASGGGATHIATVTGELKDLEDNKNSILIVAGAGGGSYYGIPGNNIYAQGGAGGGTSGLDGTRRQDTTGGTGKGGSQEAGGGCNPLDGYKAVAGTFGQGGNSSASKNAGGAGGGAGYYGGGGSTASSAGGGSGYIGGVTNGQTIDGATSMPTHDGTSTMTGNTGNGYAKITYIGN